jgi:hypothetical protein
VEELLANTTQFGFVERDYEMWFSRIKVGKISKP